MGERRSLRGVLGVLLVGAVVLAGLVHADSAPAARNDSPQQLSVRVNRDAANLRNGHLDIESVLSAVTRSACELRFVTERFAFGTSPRPLHAVLLILASLLVLGLAIASRRVRSCVTPVRGPPTLSSI